MLAVETFCVETTNRFLLLNSKTQKDYLQFVEASDMNSFLLIPFTAIKSS